MTERDQKQLGKVLWNIADQLRGAMNADDFTKIPFGVPGEAEQQQFATASQRQSELLAYKMGLMQRLFPWPERA